jgi:hypothetical protein
MQEQERNISPLLISMLSENLSHQLYSCVAVTNLPVGTLFVAQAKQCVLFHQATIGISCRYSNLIP